ncbi:helix-turn-helix transcriptional regulator [Alicycliphilus sp. T452]
MTIPQFPSPAAMAALNTPAAAATSSLAPGLPEPAAPEYPGRFRLLTKQDVCDVYGVSVRCLEMWIKQGLVPAPVHIGGRRYWHPERFYADLAAATAAPSSSSESSPAASGVPAGRVRSGKAGTRRPEPLPSSVRSEASSQGKCDDIKRRLGLA